MKNFSNIIEEGRRRTSHDSVNLLSHEIADYSKKMSKKLPEDVVKALYLLQKYNITDGEAVDEIVASNNSRLKTLAEELNISYQDIQVLKTVLVELGNNIKLLPMKMTPREREELIAGRMAMDDLTMDLESEKGRTAVVKQYGPLVYKIANQFVGKENLDKAELISAGFEGLTNAINTYKKPIDDEEIEDKAEREEAEKAKRTSFKTWASYKIRWAILAEIYDNSRTIRMSYNDRRNAYAKGETTNLTQSLDGMRGKDGDEDGSMQDHIAGLATTDTMSATEQQKKWDKLFDELGKHFSKRDVVVFLKYFGLGGEKEEKGKDIAAEFNMTPAMVTHIVTKKIIPYLKSNEDLMDILSDLLNVRMESLMVSNMYKLSKDLYEALLSDDVYLMLEEILRWKNPEVLREAVEAAMENLSDIEEFLNGGQDYIMENYKDNLKTIKEFLTNIYPTESFIRKPDEMVVERLTEIVNLWQKYGFNEK